MIEAIIIDSREPKNIQALSFGDVPTCVMALDAGDLRAVCSDGNTLLIERKTPDDFLNSLKDERLFPQLTRLVQERLDQQAAGIGFTTWPYLLITGELRKGPGGKIVTSDRGQTGWDWDAVQGALLTVQELGVMVVQCDENDYENVIIRLGKRPRGEIKLLPARYPNILGPQAAILASLPGIGIEKTLEILTWAGGHVAYALSGLTDLSVQPAPVGMATRKKIRGVLGLLTHEELAVCSDDNLDQVLDVIEKKGE